MLFIRPQNRKANVLLKGRNLKTHRMILKRAICLKWLTLRMRHDFMRENVTWYYIGKQIASEAGRIEDKIASLAFIDSKKTFLKMLDRAYNHLKYIDTFLINIIELSKKIDKEEMEKAVQLVIEIKNLIVTLKTTITE